jgi:hypothetical protein
MEKNGKHALVYEYVRVTRRRGCNHLIKDSDIYTEAISCWSHIHDLIALS